MLVTEGSLIILIRSKVNIDTPCALIYRVASGEAAINSDRRNNGDDVERCIVLVFFSPRARGLYSIKIHLAASSPIFSLIGSAREAAVCIITPRVDSDDLARSRAEIYNEPNVDLVQKSIDLRKWFEYQRSTNDNHRPRMNTEFKGSSPERVDWRASTWNRARCVPLIFHTTDGTGASRSKTRYTREWFANRERHR